MTSLRAVIRVLQWELCRLAYYTFMAIPLRLWPWCLSKRILPYVGVIGHCDREEFLSRPLWRKS